MRSLTVFVCSSVRQELVMLLRATAGLRPSANDEQRKLVLAIANFVIRLGKNKTDKGLIDICKELWDMALVSVWALVGGEFGE